MEISFALCHTLISNKKKMGRRDSCPSSEKRKEIKRNTHWFWLKRKRKRKTNNNNNIKNEDDNNIAQLTLRRNHVNSKRIVVFIFLFIYFFFFIFFLETFGKREIQNLHWQTYKVRLFMVIVITLILVSFIYVLCQLEDWRHFSNSRGIASKNRSTNLILVCICVRFLLYCPLPPWHAHSCFVMLKYCVFLCSTFFFGFKQNTMNSFHLSQKWFWMLLTSQKSQRIEAVTFY